MSINSTRHYRKPICCVEVEFSLDRHFDATESMCKENYDDSMDTLPGLNAVKIDRLFAVNVE